MSVPTDPSDLAAAAKCYDCITPEMQKAVLIYILANIAGMGATTPEQLMANAKDYAGIPQRAADSVIIYLLNELANP